MYSKSFAQGILMLSIALFVSALFLLFDLLLHCFYSSLLAVLSSQIQKCVTLQKIAFEISFQVLQLLGELSVQAGTKHSITLDNDTEIVPKVRFYQF